MRRLALLIPFCFGAASATAQAPLRFIPVFRQYTTNEGLPSNEVFAIEQDQQGYLWFGTNNGVCRFNGYTFERFPDTLQTNYSSVLTENLMEDACGRMWWADFRGRLFYHENGRIVSWAHNDTLAKLRDKFDFIQSLAVEGCGEQVWLNLRWFGLFHAYADGRWEMMPDIKGADIHYRQAGGRFMEITQSALLAEKDPRRQPVFFQAYQTYSGKLYAGGVCDYPNTVLPAGQGQHLVFSNRQLYLFHKGILQKQIPYNPPGECLYVAPDGSLLLGHTSGGGVRRYRSLDDLLAGKPELVFWEGLSANKIFRDREGGYWFSTQEQGVFYSPSLESAVMHGLPGLQDQVVTGVAATPEGLLYMGVRNGQVFELDMLSMQSRNISPGGITYLSTLYFDPETTMLVASGNHSAFLREGRWMKEFYDPHTSTRHTTSGYRYAKAIEPGLWWQASPHSLLLTNLEAQCHVYDYTLKKNTAGLRFFSVGLAAGGAVYTSTQQGLWELRNGELARPAPVHPALLLPAEDMLLMPDSSLALATRGSGVVFWKPGSEAPPHVIGQEQGLAFNRVSRLYLEPGGALWACTELGASRISPDRSRVENFTVKTGLPTSDVRQVALSGGYYWFATGAGLARMKERLAPAPMPAPIIARIEVEGLPYAIENGLPLPYDSANISMEWVALHFRSNGHIPYRYRLQSSTFISDALGHTGSWTYTFERMVNFSNLAPSSYRFEVQAQDEEGLWSKPAAWEFSILPPWWQSGWFRLLVLAILGGLGFGLYKYRTGQLKRDFAIQQQLHELERSALQAQMNPHFIFNCLNSIQGFITVNDKDRAATFLAQFARLIRQTLEHSFHKEISLEDEVAYLQNYLALEHLRFRDAFRYEIVVDESLDTYDTALPSMLVQPFVENAIVHGMKGKTSGGLVSIRFEALDNGLRISIEDNGPGYAAGEERNGKAKSYGTQLAHRRLALAAQYPNASIRSEARPEGGTRVEITLV